MPVADMQTKSLPRESALRQVAGQAPTISVKGLIITEYRPQTIIQLNGATEPATLQLALSSLGFNDGQFDSDQVDSARVYRCADTTALWNGPGMWMLVCEKASADSGVSDRLNPLNTVLQNTDATATELSHSRTILAMQGENLLEFLYSGCPIDLDNRPPDSCFSTQFGHFNILLDLKHSQHANMYVYRSFGQALWEHCQHIVATLPPYSTA